MDGQAVWGFRDDPGGGVAAQVSAFETELRRHRDILDDLRRQALSVTLLSWESPAGRSFRTYLSARCMELARTVEQLGAAAEELGSYGRLLGEVEMLQRQVGL